MTRVHPHAQNTRKDRAYKGQERVFSCIRDVHTLTASTKTYHVLVNGITILASVVHIISIICRMASTMVRNLDKSAFA